ncbi:MAG: hypothetical protein HN855_10450 [Anaerolineae bacterium]|jgi:hypothetical protein|nr:hypothetical protein [Anaerolineae bacterium]MBT7325571.1 hypothetical protein [Anaerolineae bacterium]
MSEKVKKAIDLKKGLALWVEAHTDISTFSKVMNYTYQHAWSLVRSKTPITDGVVGRFVLGYGIDALSEWFSVAQDCSSKSNK